MNIHRRHTYYVYIITNWNRKTLYTGVTNNLARRLYEHDQNILLKNRTFASKHGCRHLVFYQRFSWIKDAIKREKEIKGWIREKKENLIERINPDWDFLEHLF